MLFFETLYKTDQLKDFPEGEYFQVRLESKNVDGSEMFFVSEKHAYFSNTEKRRVNEVTTFSPEEGHSTRKEAQQRYDEQVQHRAKTGFVHLFYFDPFKKDGVGYRYIGE